MADPQRTRPVSVCDGLGIVLNLIRQGWCRDYLAKDRSGFPCQPTHPTAKVWSLDGALLVIPKVADKVGDAILRAARKYNDGQQWASIRQLNDDRSIHKAVIVKIVEEAAKAERLKRHVAAAKKK